LVGGTTVSALASLPILLGCSTKIWYIMVEGARSRHLVQRAECRRISRNNPEYREAENKQQCNRWLDPEYRETENKQQRNRRSDPEYRAREQVADTERHVCGCTSLHKIVIPPTVRRIKDQAFDGCMIVTNTVDATI
jgi:hypothetical protein